MSALASILRSGHYQCIVLQSSTAQTCLPVLRDFLSNAKTATLLVNTLYNSASLVLEDPSITVLDLTKNVKGYTSAYVDSRDKIRAALSRDGPLTLVLDTIDIILADIGSLSETYAFIFELMMNIRSRKSPSSLIIHVLAPSPILPLLVTTSFSPSLLRVTAHPSVLLVHLSKEYMISPVTNLSKFWHVFIPFTERDYESDRLVFGSSGRGDFDENEFVVELQMRGGSGNTRKRVVERELKGWSTSHGLCSMDELDTLKEVYAQSSWTKSEETAHNTSFNLDLTASQQLSRSKVPLPYFHTGKENKSSPAAIYYDPGSEDDIDDDDPDEDLDI